MFPLLILFISKTQMIEEVDKSNISVKEIYTDKPAAIINEINELVVGYSPYLDKSKIISGSILFFGVYLLFFGIYTVRLSLAFLLSIFLFHYMEEIIKEDIKLWPIDIAIIYISSFTKSSKYPFVPVMITSLLISFIFCYLLGGFRIVLGAIGTFLFYSTYMNTFINTQNEYQNYIFYASLVIVFGLIYILCSKLLNWIFCVLFSVTGSLIIFMTIEKVFDFNLQLSDLFLALKEDWDNLQPSFISMFWVLITLLGTFFQIIVISKYSGI